MFTLNLVLPYYLVSLRSDSVTVLLFTELSPFPKKFLACPLVFWRYPIASALDRGYNYFNLPGNIMSHFNGFLLLNDIDSVNAHSQRTQPSL